MRSLRPYVAGFYYAVRSNFWFIPSLLALASLVAAPVSVQIDYILQRHTAGQWLPGPTLNVEGARLILSTVAGSMITAASLVFSMTLVVLSLVANQLGPRILLIFMEDRPTQTVLGVFIATFLFSLIVLGTVGTGDVNAFVPYLAVYLTFVFAVMAFGTIIYFIHHVSTQIQADTVIANLGARLIDATEALERASQETESNVFISRPARDEFEARVTRHARPVLLEGGGYVQRIDEAWLLSLAGKHDIYVRIDVRPGHFVLRGRPVLTASPAERIDEELADQLARNVIIGPRRTSQQYVEFEISALVEVALRALSPGINDPHTAMTCVNRLGQGLSRLMRDGDGLRALTDESGQIRVLAFPQTFSHFLDSALHPVRRAGEGDMLVMTKLAQILTDLAALARTDIQRQALGGHLDALEQTAHTTLTIDADKDRMARDIRQARKALSFEDSDEKPTSSQ